MSLPPHAPARAPAPSWIVAAGGYRSGSTLQYNLIGVYLEELGVGHRAGLVEPDMIADWHDDDDSMIKVAKCHHIVGGFREFRHPSAWEPLVRSGSAMAIASERDEAAVRASMSRKFGVAPEDLDTSLEWRENLANTARWKALGAISQSYDALVERPVECVRELAAALGVEWDPTAAAIAAHLTDRSAVLTHMRTLEAGQFDPLTLVHSDHVFEASDEQADLQLTSGDR